MKTSSILLAFLVYLFLELSFAENNQPIFANIEPNSIVEGSIRHGGIQPDYIIDTTSSPLSDILVKAKKIGEKYHDFSERVKRIVILVKSNFKYTGYSSRKYLEVINQYKSSKIPLSEYLKCQSGVCREHALVLHMALKEAQIPNSHVYAKIYRASHDNKNLVVEDHAFTIVFHQGKQWAVDAYSEEFNGYSLIDLMSPEGLTVHSVGLPFAKRSFTSRRIVSLNSFPKIYRAEETSSCLVFYKR